MSNVQPQGQLGVVKGSSVVDDLWFRPTCNVGIFTLPSEDATLSAEPNANVVLYKARNGRRGVSGNDDNGGQRQQATRQTRSVKVAGNDVDAQMHCCLTFCFAGAAPEDFGFAQRKVVVVYSPDDCVFGGPQRFVVDNPAASSLAKFGERWNNAAQWVLSSQYSSSARAKASKADMQCPEERLFLSRKVAAAASNYESNCSSYRGGRKKGAAKVPRNHQHQRQDSMTAGIEGANNNRKSSKGPGQTKRDLGKRKRGKPTQTSEGIIANGLDGRAVLRGVARASSVVSRPSGPTCLSPPFFRAELTAHRAAGFNGVEAHPGWETGSTRDLRLGAIGLRRRAGEGRRPGQGCGIGWVCRRDDIIVAIIVAIPLMSLCTEKKKR
ncbi:hypothetical protein Q7P37_001062 [Cladosporium fusiforme]